MHSSNFNLKETDLSKCGSHTYEIFGDTSFSIHHFIPLKEISFDLTCVDLGKKIIFYQESVMTLYFVFSIDSFW